MSRKKISTTISLTPEVYGCLEKERQERERSYGFIVEELLREKYQLPRRGEGADQHGDKVTTA